MHATVRMGQHLWRPLTASDADTAFVLALRNDERFRRMFYQPTVTTEMHHDFIRRAGARDEINWLIETPRGPGGVASIYNLDLAHRKCECGRVAMIEPRLFFMSWIVSGFIVFDTMGLNEAYIETLAENRTIARGVGRMGMVRERVLRGHVIRDGTPLDVALCAITADGWCARRDAHYERWGKPELLSFDGPKVEG